MKCVPDIIYQPAHQLSLDFYVPDALVSKACLIYAHAGAHLGGTQKDTAVLRIAEAFTQQGFSVAAIEFRQDLTLGDFTEEDAYAIVAAKLRSTKVGLTLASDLFSEGYHASIEDISAAIEFLSIELPTLAVQCEQIGVLGMAAGGIAALGTAFAPRHMVDRITHPSAIATIGAVLVQPWRMRSDAPPCLLINGAEDGTVPLDSARIGQSRANALSANFEMITTDDAFVAGALDQLLVSPSGTQTEHFHRLLAHFDRFVTS